MAISLLEMLGTLQSLEMITPKVAEFTVKRVNSCSALAEQISFCYRFNYRICAVDSSTLAELPSLLFLFNIGINQIVFLEGPR